MTRWSHHSKSRRYSNAHHSAGRPPSPRARQDVVVANKSRHQSPSCSRVVPIHRARPPHRTSDQVRQQQLRPGLPPRLLPLLCGEATSARDKAARHERSSSYRCRPPRWASSGDLLRQLSGCRVRWGRDGVAARVQHPLSFFPCCGLWCFLLQRSGWWWRSILAVRSCDLGFHGGNVCACCTGVCFGI